MRRLLQGALGVGLLAAGPALAQGLGAAGCPPGLAAKGCLPPGQARKLGAPMTPPAVVVQPPPVVYLPAPVDIAPQPSLNLGVDVPLER